MNLFTFPLEKPFIDVLAAHVLRVHGAEAESLARVLVLLPSHRACIAFREACLRISGGKPLLLPRMQGLGDVEDEFGEVLADESMEDLPPAIAPVKRHMLLTELVAADLRRAFPHLKADKAQAALLAKDLARLLDDMAREERDFSGLAALVPEELAEHWQQTVAFLEIVARHWPKILEEEGECDPIIRRGAALTALAEHWKAHPPEYPVIAAGSTGSQTATRRLLGVVAALPNGKVILPALDKALDNAAWETLVETHPQAGLKRLLAALGGERDNVQILDEITVAPSCSAERICLLRTALLPASSISQWQEQKVESTAALAHFQRADCVDLQEEARVVALALREALETPGKTAGLVTADRTLARMVATELRRFGIAIDDSAGRPLLNTPPAIFLMLVIEAALADAAPIPLLSLLKHPFCAAGMTPAECRKAVRLLEIAELRGVRLSSGLGALARAAEHDKADPMIGRLINYLMHSMRSLVRATRQQGIHFATLLDLHLRAMESMADKTRLFAGTEGEALANALSEIRLHAQSLADIDPQHYPGLLSALLSAFSTRATRSAHPRLHILSPIEARLQHHDLLILSGLNEGSWPPEPEASPWMGWNMRARFGLPPPDRAIGMAAHDFWMLASAREVLLTRAAKSGGTQTAPSRFLLRLTTCMQAMEGKPWEWPLPDILHWARSLNMPLQMPPATQPMPTPPVSARPRSLSVTQIEVWQRDPYAIYAKYILNLTPLDPIDREPSAMEFGNIVHAALERFTQAYPETLPEDPFGQLLVFGEEAFAPYRDRPAIHACWWPRFVAAAQWIIAKEQERRPLLAEILPESKSTMMFEGPCGPFTLKTRIDRLERHKDGGLSVLDYKTGHIPNDGDRKAGIALQLPLEAALAALDSTVHSLHYWKLAGVKSEEKVIAKNALEAIAQIKDAIARVTALIAAYDDPNTPYIALPDPQYAPHFNPYAHLERQAEWEG